MESETRKPQPSDWIGVFDSGLGGVSILREIVRELPRERIFYFADNLHLPYGPRPLEEVRHFAIAIAGGMMRLPAKAVVVACNTASAAALKHLRAAYPDTPFVGMEPAVKPAAAESRTRKVGVLATQATFQGELFESVVARFAHDALVLRQPCPGLAEFIESHPFDHPALDAMLEKFIRPLLAQGIDALVLGCTHYALVKPAILKIVGDGVRVVDPSAAIARRLRSVLAAADLLAADGEGELVFNVSGEPEAFSNAASLYLGREVRAEKRPFWWIPAMPEDVADIW